MYQSHYYVPKKSNTYADMLEAVGFAHFLKRLVDDEENDIKIKDNGVYYEVELLERITEDMVEKAKYFDLFPYIKKSKDKLKEDILNYIDYDEENKKQSKYNDILKNTDEDKMKLSEKLEKAGLKPRDDWPLISSLNKLKALDSYKKLYLNVYRNKENFPLIIKLILELYSSPIIDEKIVKKKIKELEKSKVLKHVDDVNSVQIVNPDKVKGANNSKARSISSGPINAFWIREYFKMGGIYRSMVTRNIKISKKTWDKKAYVFSISQAYMDKLDIIYNRFSKELKGMTSVRLDILSLLQLSKLLIEYLEKYEIGRERVRRRYNLKNFVYGFYTAYFKDMGNASSPTNISFLELPDFIDVDSYAKGQEWIQILDEHMSIISNIKITDKKQDETGSVLNVLQEYRQFLTTSNIEIFLDFMVDYATFLMQQIDKGNFYVKAFKLNELEVFLVNVDNDYSVVFQNEGFKSIAKAIRNSTISAQYKKARNDGSIKYPIKYGLAQDIKRKAPYKDELIEYISDFITWYNSETAKVAERKPEFLREGKIRSTVKYQDIEEFISLLENDKFDSNVIGKLLCAYGYSLDKKEKKYDEKPNNKVLEG